MFKIEFYICDLKKWMVNDKIIKEIYAITRVCKSMMTMKLSVGFSFEQWIMCSSVETMCFYVESEKFKFCIQYEKNER